MQQIRTSRRLWLVWLSCSVWASGLSGCAGGPNWTRAFLGLPGETVDDRPHLPLPSATLRTQTRSRPALAKPTTGTLPTSPKSRVAAKLTDDYSPAAPPESIASVTFTKPPPSTPAAETTGAWQSLPQTSSPPAATASSAAPSHAMAAVAPEGMSAPRSSSGDTPSYPATNMPSLEEFIAANFAELREELAARNEAAAPSAATEPAAAESRLAGSPAASSASSSASPRAELNPAPREATRRDGAVQPASAEVEIEAEPPPVPENAIEAPAYQAGDWQKEREQLIVAIEQEIQLAQRDAARRAEVPHLETQLRLQHAMAGRRDEAARPIEGLRDEEQEFWKHEAYGLVDLLAADRLASDSRRYAVALTSLEEARQQLATAGSLTLKNIAFCRKVEDFGRVERFEKLDFTRNQEVLLYVEVRNFSALHTKLGYETELQGSFRVLDRAGAARSERLLPLDRQTCENMRHDYYIAYRIYIPAELTPGAYSLELTIEDKKGHKSNNALLDFNVIP